MRLPLKRYLALFLTYLKPQWGRTLLMSVTLLASIGLQLLGPQILRYFIDTAIAGGPSTSLLLAGLYFIGVTLANQVVSVATTYLSENVAWTATNQLRTDLLAHCLSLDLAFHKEHTAGEMIERIDGDVDALSNFFSRFVVNLLSNALLVLGVLILLFQVNWLVGLAMSTFAALALVILMLIRRRAIPYWVQLRQVNADFSSFLEEQLTGIEDTRGNGATHAVMRLFYLLLRRWLPVNRKAEFLDYLLGATTLLIFIFGSALSLSLGAYLWSISVITVGTVYLMWSYTDRISGPIQEIQTQLQDLQQAEACMHRIAELFQTQPTIRDGRGTCLKTYQFLWHIIRYRPWLFLAAGLNTALFFLVRVIFGFVIQGFFNILPTSRHLSFALWAWPCSFSYASSLVLSFRDFLTSCPRAGISASHYGP